MLHAFEMSYLDEKGFSVLTICSIALGLVSDCNKLLGLEIPSNPHIWIEILHLCRTGIEPLDTEVNDKRTVHDTNLK